MRVMRPSVRRMGTLLMLVALLGGCVKISSAPGSSPAALPSATPGPGATATPTPAPTPTRRPTVTPTSRPTVPAEPTPTATPDDGSQTIEVELADSLTIDPDKMTVTAGVPVHFVVTNTGALDHDFFIGTDKEQKTRESQKGEPGKDRFVAVPPGQTVELTYTFDEPGKLIAGCTIPGHYSGGMRATITIKEP
jgi:uncharacterized cupredoxin-like copper-binding protein